MRPKLDLKDKVRAAAMAAVDGGDGTTPGTNAGTGTVPGSGQPADTPGAEQEAAETGWFLDGPPSQQFDRLREHFGPLLPKHIGPGHFAAAVLEALPDLAGCSPGSIRNAFRECARFGLVPDGVHAVVKADGPVARFVPMYQGYIDMMYRSDQVGAVHANTIREHDQLRYTPSAPSPDDFLHQYDPLMSEGERGGIVGVYAFAWLVNGGETTRSRIVFLNRSQAEEIRDTYSDDYRRAVERGVPEESPWHTHFWEMALKSALRRLMPYVPNSRELVALARADADFTGAPVPATAEDDTAEGTETTTAEEDTGEDSGPGTDA
ncbi:MAG TPA: recombinase RecT [Streptomyces sp.]|nr:recombinase RecT [Streptomyces sp.]